LFILADVKGRLKTGFVFSDDVSCNILQLS